jgi:hypothetical protein
MRLQNIADLLRWVVKLQPCFLDDPFNAVGCLLLRKQSRDFFAVLLRMLLEAAVLFSGEPSLALRAFVK